MSIGISSPRVLRSVRRYCRANHITPTRFGRTIAGDARFVTGLREGRRPTRKATRLVRAAITSDAAQGPASGRRA